MITAPGRSETPDPANGRGFKRGKIAVACFFVLLLMYAGVRGKQHALLQAKLKEITRACDQVQSQVDEGIVLFRGQPGPPDDGVKASANVLSARLQQFDAEYGLGQLSKIEGLELRLSKAALANAQRRFGDALLIIAEEDEKGGSMAGKELMTRVLRSRADALYGVRQWKDALERYQRILDSEPDDIVARTRIADCQIALGRVEDALISQNELARRHNERGDALLVQGKPDIAIKHYTQAIAVQSRLIEAGQKQLGTALAASYNKRGDASLFMGKWDAAGADFEKAVETLTPLVENGARDALAKDLAKSHENRGNAFLVQGKADAAAKEFEMAIKSLAGTAKEEERNQFPVEVAENYFSRGNAFLAKGDLNGAAEEFDRAIKILTTVTEPTRRTQAQDGLARCFNNQGVLWRAQRKSGAAIEDFEKAIQIFTTLAEQERGRAKDVTQDQTGSRAGGSGAVRLEIAMVYADRGIEALIRTWPDKQARRRELLVLLGVSLKNRGYAHLTEGRVAAAIDDFKSATEVYDRLVNEEGESNLGAQLARSLSPLAWVYATHADPSFRDGPKAKQYALRACELTEWKVFAPVETLAAAYAETGGFAEAVQWQEKALALAPPKYADELRSRLALYKSGKPYRALRQPE